MERPSLEAARIERSSLEESRTWSVALQPDRVDEGIYISSTYTEQELHVLQAHGISHILQAGYELQPHHPQQFQYARLDLPDLADADIVPWLPAAFKFINSALQQQGKVLVHCVHGQSRSAAVVIAYLMWRDRRSYADCLQQVRTCRPRVAPNCGFELQLCCLADMGFDLARWPGWNSATLAAVQQQLLQQQLQQLHHAAAAVGPLPCQHEPPLQQQQLELAACSTAGLSNSLSVSLQPPVQVELQQQQQHAAVAGQPCSCPQYQPELQCQAKQAPSSQPAVPSASLAALQQQIQLQLQQTAALPCAPSGGSLTQRRQQQQQQPPTPQALKPQHQQSEQQEQLSAGDQAELQVRIVADGSWDGTKAGSPAPQRGACCCIM